MVYTSYIYHILNLCYIISDYLPEVPELSAEEVDAATMNSHLHAIVVVLLQPYEIIRMVIQKFIVPTVK